MKRYYSAFFILCFSFLYGQEKLEIIKTFPFGDPFKFITRWDANEGGPSNPNNLVFNPNGIGLITVFESKKSFVLDEKYDLSENGQVLNPTPYLLRTFFDSYIYGVYDNRIGYKVCKNNDNYQKGYQNIIPKGELNCFNVPYKTGKYFFIDTTDSPAQMVSWEVKSDNQVLYRDAAATEALLASKVGEELGYKKSQDGYLVFGENEINSDAPPYGWATYKNYLFPESGEYSRLTRLPYPYIGTDKKGISYFCIYSIPVDVAKPFEKIGITFAFVDPWTRKVYFEKVTPGQWNPPRFEKGGLIGPFPTAVHPNGNIYLFDADTQKKEYQLKRLKNTWWAKMGLDTRVVGRINQNRVPLFSEADGASALNGYQYENEYVWVLEESKKTVAVNGKPSPLLKVRKLDGREGWMPAAHVNKVE